MAEEATKLGEVVRLSVFSQHPDGPILIRFRSAGAAVEAISAFNGRFFGGRRITCEFWDGKTDYRCVRGGGGGGRMGEGEGGSPPLLVCCDVDPGSARPHAAHAPPEPASPPSRRPKVSGDAAAEAKRIDDFGKWLEEGDG